jgi:N-acetylglucosaminyldiphosphoundecaprenol N-acetyl-beta-D-mannosaminyltransferase
MTPNNEMVVMAQRDPNFMDIVQNSQLNLADSTGILLVSTLSGQRLPCRNTGVDTVQELCKTLGSDSPIFLLGAAPGVAQKTAEILQSRSPLLRVVGTDAGWSNDDDAPRILTKINEAKPHLLLVAFGAPKQDEWIAKYLPKLPSVRVAMGIGGTFDFIAGTQTRAPKFMRTFGLEWLYRLVREPKRFKRIFNAVIVFPWLCLLGLFQVGQYQSNGR